MGYFWWYLSSSHSSALNDSVWPFPGLYLLEATLLSIGVFVFVVIERRSGRSLGMASYFFVGALSALVVLGAFSIGGALIPALLTLAIAVPLSGLGTPRRWLGSLLALVLGMAVQVALMLLVLALPAARRWSW